MAMGRVIVALASVLAAGSAQAAAPVTVRLPLRLATLDAGGEVSYHPSRWLAIRRSLSFVRSDIPPTRTAPVSLVSRPLSATAMAGDIHPFGGGFRVSLGLREDPNRRLLRVSNDSAAIGTASYAPTLSLGYAGTIADRVSVSADLGLSGRTLYRQRERTLLTSLDIATGVRNADNEYRPSLRVSAGYRF